MNRKIKDFEIVLSDFIPGDECLLVKPIDID